MGFIKMVYELSESEKQMLNRLRENYSESMYISLRELYLKGL